MTLSSTYRLFDRRMCGLLLIVVLLGGALIAFGPRDSLDTKLYYSGATARAFLRGLDAQESQRYFLNELIDLIFICSYTGALAHGFRKTRPLRPTNSILVLAPGVFDGIETGGILYALSVGGPDSAPDGFGMVTAAKWIFGVAAVLALARAAYPPSNQTR